MVTTASDPRHGEPDAAGGAQRTGPRPMPPIPDNPADIALDAVIDYAEQTAKWLMEQCMHKTATEPTVAKARQIEARSLAELQRTLERIVRLKKQYASDKVTKKNHDDLAAELIAGLHKIADARGT